ncbi:hypothetical protein DSO57_1029970 [Entomophthora muscae]|uniref:Uncharacterized protein n=1 Tax=Entomophthora muscae TaxID=34485 RepID=A0ACC2TC04_9FUNG|nr:hypothetical protein DSO57_1029970 [Entomophthora muscae]
MLSYKEAMTDQTEAIFKTSYSIKNISLQDPQTQGISTQLKLPPPNEYVMRKVTTHTSNMAEDFNDAFYSPKRIILDKSGELWAISNTSLKSSIHLSITKSQPITLPEFALVNLLLEIRFRSLGEIEHHFSMTHYLYSMLPKDDRIEISIWGFNKYLSQAFKRLVTALKQPSVTKVEFDMYKDLVKHPTPTNVPGNQKAQELFDGKAKTSSNRKAQLRPQQPAMVPRTTYQRHQRYTSFQCLTSKPSNTTQQKTTLPTYSREVHCSFTCMEV